MSALFRRGALVPGILLCMLGTAANANTQTWAFQVYLDDMAIGHHHFVLTEKEAERELVTDARFNVKLLFIDAYRYAHDASERWNGNCLVSLAARTDDNGKKSMVNAERWGERVRIDTPHGSVAVEGCVMSFAYWNPDILRQTRLLNSQTGQYEMVTIAALGDEQILVRGAPVQARRYRISGPKNPIDVWYGAGQRWLALQSTLDGGRTLRYRLK